MWYGQKENPGIAKCLTDISKILVLPNVWQTFGKFWYCHLWHSHQLVGSGLELYQLWTHGFVSLRLPRWLLGLVFSLPVFVLLPLKTPFFPRPLIHPVRPHNGPPRLWAPPTPLISALSVTCLAFFEALTLLYITFAILKSPRVFHHKSLHLYYF